MAAWEPLAPGAFADIVGFRGDLMDDPVDDLPSRQPALTVVGGRAVHDPDACSARPAAG
jgi:predicted amidohydrolase YtcJ